MANDAEKTMPFSCEIKLRYPSERSAGVAMAALEVDREIRPERNSKAFSKDGSVVTVLSGLPSSINRFFSATQAKGLRVAVSNFCDHVIVVSRTMQEFEE